MIEIKTINDFADEVAGVKIDFTFDKPFEVRLKELQVKNAMMDLRHKINELVTKKEVSLEELDEYDFSKEQRRIRQSYAEYLKYMRGSEES